MDEGPKKVQVITSQVPLRKKWMNNLDNIHYKSIIFLGWEFTTGRLAILRRDFWIIHSFWRDEKVINALWRSFSTSGLTKSQSWHRRCMLLRSGILAERQFCAFKSNLPVDEFNVNNNCLWIHFLDGSFLSLINPTRNYNLLPLLIGLQLTGIGRLLFKVPHSWNIFLWVSPELRVTCHII